MSPEGIVTRTSAFSVKETIDKLANFLKEHGTKVYARIDQQAELMQAGITARPLEFLLFGNPKIGGRLMQANPQSALDLPLKLIAWEDEQGKTRISWNRPNEIGERYGLPEDALRVLDLAPLLSMVLGPGSDDGRGR